MLANELIHKIKYDVMLNTLDVPITCDGKKIVGVEFLGSNEDGNISINIRTKKSYREGLELENTE